MTAAHKAAKAWYDANPVNADFKPTADRQEFIDDMVRRLTGHLEPYFKAEYWRTMRGRLILRPIPPGDLVRLNRNILK